MNFYAQYKDASPWYFISKVLIEFPKSHRMLNAVIAKQNIVNILNQNNKITPTNLEIYGLLQNIFSKSEELHNLVKL